MKNAKKALNLILAGKITRQDLGVLREKSMNIHFLEFSTTIADPENVWVTACSDPAAELTGKVLNRQQLEQYRNDYAKRYSNQQTLLWEEEKTYQNL